MLSIIPPPLQADVEYCYHRLSRLMLSIVPPPLQADVEYCYHRLSRPTFIAIFFTFLSSRHRITTLHVLSIFSTIRIASIFTFHISKLLPESITHGT
ncbi:hypothetical protein QL285_053830 [Trifolium repens]|nr:hypothetical protein QL285_053830 [Trifolium repens]